MAPKYVDADSQYAKDPKLRKEDVKILLEWIKKASHLPNITELKAILFLQSCYYRIESAKTCIENYYTIKAHCPEIFANRKYSSVATAMKLSTAFLLPEQSVHGYSVLFCKLLDGSTDEFNCADLVKYFDMVVSLVFRQIGTSEGHVLVVDMDGVTFGHIAKVNVTIARKYVYFLQEAMHVRVKEIHIVNVSAIAQKLLSLVKPFIKSEILDAMHIHPSIDGLLDYVPKEALPSDYGGKGDSVKDIVENQKREFQASDDFFLAEEREITDELKRMALPKSISDVFGVEGTFKKLNID